MKSIWSIREVDLATRGNEVAYKGSFDATYPCFYFGKTPKPLAVVDPTWLDLYMAGERLIRESGDGHHIYIEYFERKGKTLEMVTGS